MKKAVLFLAITLSTLVSPFVSAAEPLDETRLQLVRNHCVAAQATLQQVLRSDTVTRINRGRSYEETVKLLAAFNSRAALNTYDASRLVQTTALFEAEFTAFKSSWIAYETSLREALRIKCQEQPNEFYAALVKTRELRVRLTAHIAVLSQLLDTYKTGFDEIRTDIMSRSES